MAWHFVAGFLFPLPGTIITISSRSGLQTQIMVTSVSKAAVQQIKKRLTPGFLWTILPLILLGFGVRVYRLAGQSMWWDEMATIARSTLPLREMISNLFTIRNHMPLYFVLMKGWLLVGTSEFIARYFSALIGTLTIAVIAKSGRLIGGRKVGYAAALLLAISPFNIWFSQEARMYSLLAFSTLAGNWFLLLLLKTEKRSYWLGYAGFMLLAVYSHYLAVLVLIAHYVFFSLHYRLNKQLFRHWMIYGGFVGVAFGIWIGLIFASGGFTRAPIGWIAAAHWYEPFFTLLSFSAGPSIDRTSLVPYAALLIYLIALISGSLRYYRKPTGTVGMTPAWLPVLHFRLIVLWLFIPLLLTYLVSLDLPIPQKRSVYMDRYLIIALPAFLLLGAWGLSSLSSYFRLKWLLPLGLIVLGLTSLLSLQNMFFDRDYQRDAWRQAMDHMAGAWQPGDVYLATANQLLGVWYYGENRFQFEQIPEFNDVELNQGDAGENFTDWKVEISKKVDRVWLMTVIENGDPHGFPEYRNAAVRDTQATGLVDSWLEEDCYRLDQRIFSGLRLTLYDLKGCRTSS